MAHYCLITAYATVPPSPPSIRMSSAHHPEVPGSSATHSSASPSGDGAGSLPRTDDIASEYEITPSGDAESQGVDALMPHAARPSVTLSASDEAHSTDGVTHFSGSWNHEKRVAITKAIEAAEQMISHRSEYPVPTFGAQWVCVMDTVMDRTFFLAHRLGASKVLRGNSISELRTAICAFALDH